MQLSKTKMRGNEEYIKKAEISQRKGAEDSKSSMESKTPTPVKESWPLLTRSEIQRLVANGRLFFEKASEQASKQALADVDAAILEATAVAEAQHDADASASYLY